MSIAQRSDGRWIVKFKDEATGRWAQRSFKEQGAAAAFEEETNYDRKENERLTLGDAVVAFLANVPHARDTAEDYSFLINGYDRKRDGGHTEGPAEFLADKFCTELTRRDLENFRMRLRERGQSVVTLNQNVNKIKAALNWAAEQEMIPDNPWRKYRSVPGGRNRPRMGRMEDFMRIYSVLPPWFQWACRTAMALCLRPGVKELFSLTWASFDWRNGAVTVFMPKVAREKTVIPPQWYLEEARPRFEADRAAGRSIVCPGPKGRQIVTPEGYRRTWRCRCAKAGVRMPLYALRHITASEMLAAGADLAAVAAQLGHSSPATTASFYAHAIARSQRLAAGSIPRLHQFGAPGAGKSE